MTCPWPHPQTLDPPVPHQGGGVLIPGPPPAPPKGQGVRNGSSSSEPGCWTQPGLLQAFKVTRSSEESFPNQVCPQALYLFP